MSDTPDRIILTCGNCEQRSDLQIPADATHWECLVCETVQEVPRYTLPEAQRILSRMYCDINGHELSSVIVHSETGTLVSHMIRCDRCATTFSEDPK